MFDQQQLDDLFLRASKVLGSERWASTKSQPRMSAFQTLMTRRIKENNNQPELVTDEMIEGIYRTLDKLWPPEAESLLKAFSQPTD